MNLSLYSSVDFIYPVALLLAAIGFWAVFRIQPDKRSALWFALSYVCGAFAFIMELLRYVLPEFAVALFTGGLFNAMAACFVVGLVLLSLIHISEPTRPY